MKILSFDTSTPTLSVALMHDGKIVSDKEVPPFENRQQAVSQLMPTIDVAVKELGWVPESLDLLVVGVGPGSFTGIRTGVVTGRTLAQALCRPLIGMDAFKCYAASIDLPGAIILSGGRGHYFMAAYTLAGASPVEPHLRWSEKDSALEVLIEPRCATAAEVPQVISDLTESSSQPLRVYCDSASLEGLQESLTGCMPLPELSSLAIIQAQVAFRDYNLSGEDRESLLPLYSFERVNPLYLRGASITLKKTDAR